VSANLVAFLLGLGGSIILLNYVAIRRSRQISRTNKRAIAMGDDVMKAALGLTKIGLLALDLTDYMVEFAAAAVLAAMLPAPDSREQLQESIRKLPVGIQQRIARKLVPNYALIERVFGSEFKLEQSDGGE